jgi:hypothetical protein
MITFRRGVTWLRMFVTPLILLSLVFHWRTI